MNIKKYLYRRHIIRVARPNLKDVAPLTHKIVLGFGYINIIIAWILFHVPTTLKSAPFAITPQNGFIGYREWGIIYFILGIFLLYSLRVNEWKWVRRGMIFGLFTKIVWTIALVLLAFQGYPIFVTMTLWLFMAWVQAWTIIHFTPVINEETENGDAQR